MEPQKPISIEAIKYVGSVLGLIPLSAGLLFWIVIGSWEELWHEMHRRLTRFDSHSRTANLLRDAVTATIVCLTLFLITALMRRWLVRRNGLLGMQATTWRILLSGCNVAGFGLGAIFYFTSR